MDNRASFITYKGTEIYFVDYRNIKKTEEFLEAIEGTNKFREGLKKEGRKDLLMLVDVTGSFVFGDILDRLKKSKKETVPLLKKSAIVGVSGSKKILLNIVNAFTNFESKAFDSQEDALNWLIK